MARLMGTMHRHSVFSFFTIAFAISWAIWIPIALMGIRIYPGTAWPSHIPGLLGPMVAAFAMWAVVGGRPGVMGMLRRMVDWRVAPFWYLAALSPLVFFAIAAVATGVTGKGWPEIGE